MDVIYKSSVSIAPFLFHASGPLKTDMAVVHLLTCLFIRPLKEDINQHHYCRFPPLAQLTKPCKGQDAGMKGNARGKRLSWQKPGEAKCLNQLSIKRTFTRLILFGNQTLWYVTKHSVCVYACMCNSESQLSSFWLCYSPAHVPLSLSVLPNSFASEEISKWTSWSNRSQTEGEREKRRDGGGGVSNPRRRNFLLCKHSFHQPCMLPPSQTGVNTLEGPGLSQSSGPPSRSFHRHSQSP